MLDTSREAVDRALRCWVPEYAGRLHVAGDLRADELLASAGRRAETRARLGVESRQFVALMSTWGPHGLVQSHGKALLHECRRLADAGAHEFVFTMHQNLWDPDKAGTTEWRDLATSLSGPHFHVVGPGEDWTDLIAATDVALSDHTSLSMLYSVLRRPLIPVSVDPGLLVDDSFFRWLVENRVPVRAPEGLRRALATAETSYNLAGAPSVIDEPGRSAELTARAVAKVLAQRGERQRLVGWRDL
jgi:hypothetical protein